MTALQKALAALGLEAADQQALLAAAAADATENDAAFKVQLGAWQPDDAQAPMAMIGVSGPGGYVRKNVKLWKMIFDHADEIKAAVAQIEAGGPALVAQLHAAEIAKAKSSKGRRRGR